MRSQPSAVSAAAVSTGRLKYPDMTFGARSQISPTIGPEGPRPKQIHDPKLDPLVRPAGGPEQMLAGSVGVVVGPVEVDDPAGRLGQPVEPEHRAVERA